MSDYNVIVSVESGSEGQASVVIHRDSQVGEFVEAFERLLLFLGYQKESIRKAFDGAGYLASGEHKTAEEGE